MSVAFAGRLPVVMAASVIWVGTVPARAADGSPGGIDLPIIIAQLRAGGDLEGQPGRGGGMLRCDYGEGGRVVRLNADGTQRVLTEEFDSACEFDVSFDGQRILFAGRRGPEDLWNIWEMNADGAEVRRVTKDLGNCRSPAYQATLYTIISTEPWYQIMFLSDLAGQMNEYGGGPATSLYSCRMDGSAVRRLTLNLSDDLDPFLMAEGRVLLACWQRMDLRRNFRGRISLFGVNTDGADYALFCGDQGRRVKHMPCVTSEGLAVFVEADRVGWDGAGRLAAVTLRRNFYSHRVISDETEWLYHSPSPLPDGSLLVSRRPADGSGTHGVYRLDPNTGKAELIFDDPAYHDFHARVLGPRPQPDGRSSVVNEKYPTGKLYCLNAYLTDPPVQQHMRPGLIRRLRVLEGVPLTVDEPSSYLPEGARTGLGGPGSTVNGLAPVVQKRLLGDVRVEADGSFHLELPADVPVQLQTLDENGMALRSCGWIWVKHREPRGCIGCHEDPELAPENRFVEALKKPGVRLLLPPEKRRTVDFRREVMPIITGKCATAQCHGSDTAKLPLSDEPRGPFNLAYVNLMSASAHATLEQGPVVGRYVHPGQARTSCLIWRLYGRNTSRPWDASYRPAQRWDIHPPAGAQPLSAKELTTFVEWIDLGAHYDGVPGADRLGAEPEEGEPGKAAR